MLFLRQLKIRVNNPEQTGKFRDNSSNEIKARKQLDPQPITSVWSIHTVFSREGRVREISFRPNSQAFESMPEEVLIVYLIKRQPLNRNVSRIRSILGYTGSDSNIQNIKHRQSQQTRCFSLTLQHFPAVSEFNRVFQKKDLFISLAGLMVFSNFSCF